MGRTWVFKDNVSTDHIIPGRFNISTNPEELKKHAFKYARPEFARKVQIGDIVVARENFGCGSSREHAALVLKALRVHLIAESYGWIFKRNCINIGLLPIESLEKLNVKDGSLVKLDLCEYFLYDLFEKKKYRLKTPPNFVLSVYKAGGLIEYLNKRKEYRIYNNKKLL